MGVDRMNSKLGMGAIAIAVATLLLPACAANRQSTEPATQADGLTAEEVTEAQVEPSELTSNLENYMGREVAVRGQASDSVGNNAFIIEADQWVEAEPVLVFNATGAPFLLPDNNIAVRAAGQVRQFALVELEQEYGVELDATLYRPYEGQPALIAQTITLAPEPEAVINNPQAFYGRVVTVQGTINNFLAPTVFQIDGDRPFNEQGLLVMGNTPDTTLTQGQPRAGENVVVTGIIRPFRQAELERDYALDWEQGTQAQVAAEHSNKPALIAQEINRLEQ